MGFIIWVETRIAGRTGSILAFCARGTFPRAKPISPVRAACIEIWSAVYQKSTARQRYPTPAEVPYGQAGQLSKARYVAAHEPPDDYLAES
jgi:hypothetical protein